MRNKACAHALRGARMNHKGGWQRRIMLDISPSARERETVGFVEFPDIERNMSIVIVGEHMSIVCLKSPRADGSKLDGQKKLNS